MNLNISYNWLKEYVALKKSPLEFAKEISLCGPSVDHIKEMKPNFSKVVIGEILKIENHPDADKLHVCKVNVGHKEPLQIVCGANNIKEGQKVPVVLVGGKVGDFEIKEAKLRGVESFGMMCSARELGISEDHAGIFILPEYTEVGLPLEKVMPLNDFILDIEVTSNRPDAMNVVGIAREAAAIMDEKFLYHAAKPSLKIHESKKISVEVKEADVCPRYQAVVMTGIKVASSPLWMQQRLIASGLRPINNLVDITNYILLELGQPMHVFDYDKLIDQKIIVRYSKSGENILALDGKEYELVPGQLVIADNKRPIAVAGVMGGELTAASHETKNIVLESANFNSVSVRKTARGLNLHSDSSNLYEKGLNPEGTEQAILRAIELVKELAGGKIASEVIDKKAYKNKEKKIKLHPESVNKVLGISLSSEKIKKILKTLGFEVKDGKILEVTVPWFREKDIEGEHDLIEEVARIYGYHNLPAILPQGSIPTNYLNQDIFKMEDKIKDILVGLGFSELYSYSFVSEKNIRGAGLDPEKHIKISNPLNLDFEFMRTSLVPSIAETIESNSGFLKKIKVFELSKVYLPKHNDLPKEISSLAFAIAGESKENVYLEVKGALEALLSSIYIKDIRIEKASEIKTYFSANETADIKYKNKKLGSIGLINKQTIKNFGLKTNLVVAEIDFEILLEAMSENNPTYTPIPKFPAIELDLSMEIDANIPYGEITKTVEEIEPIIKSVSFLSSYQGDKISKDKKALAIRIEYRDNEKTLTLQEAQAIHDKVVAGLKKSYNINIR